MNKQTIAMFTSNMQHHTIPPILHYSIKDWYFLSRKNRNAEANLKSAKHHTQLPVMPSDCQLDPPMHRRNPSGTSTPIVAGDSHRLSPQFMADPPDIDDTDPDVIPNQHGKFENAFDLSSSFHEAFETIFV